MRVMSQPAMVMVPLSAMKLPAMALSRVDLPAPLAPIIVMKSPFSTLRERSLSTSFSFGVPGLKDFEMWEMSSIRQPSFRCAGQACAYTAEAAP